MVAGGSGRRAAESADDVPKQFRNLSGRILFEWSLDAFAVFGCRPIVLVLPPPDVDRWRSKMSDREVEVVAGGTTRQRSVSNGLSRIEAEYVLVHDAARPFVDQLTIGRVVDELAAGADAVVPCVRVSETVKERRGDSRVRTIDRDNLWVAQTPQGFVTSTLKAAHLDAPGDDVATDDAQLIERSGGDVRIVEGSPGNIKITSSHDLLVAEAIATRL